MDTNVWVENNRVISNFYSNPMATQKLIHRDSAMGKNSNMASLAQNMIRHMRNTSERLLIEERIRVVNIFTMKLARIRQEG